MTFRKQKFSSQIQILFIIERSKQTMHCCRSPTSLLISGLIFLVCGPTTGHTGTAAPTGSPPLFSPQPGVTEGARLRRTAPSLSWRLGGSETLAWVPAGSAPPGRSQYVFASPTSHPPAWHKRTASYSPLFYILFYILKWRVHVCVCVWYSSVLWWGADW